MDSKFNSIDRFAPIHPFSTDYLYDPPGHSLVINNPPESVISLNNEKDYLPKLEPCIGIDNPSGSEINARVNIDFSLPFKEIVYEFKRLRETLPTIDIRKYIIDMYSYGPFRAPKEKLDELLESYNDFCSNLHCSSETSTSESSSGPSGLNQSNSSTQSTDNFKGVYSDNTRTFNNQPKSSGDHTINHKKNESISKEKMQFYKHDKKNSLLDKNNLNSSRWSNSHQKHSKKGIEKIKGRDRREAARDGLEVFIEEQNSIGLNRSGHDEDNSNKIFQIETYSNFSLNGILDCPAVAKVDGIESKNSNLCDQQNTSEDINTSDEEYRNRLNSTCSVDSEDSYIVFDKSNSDESFIVFGTDSDAHVGDNSETEDDSDFSCSDSDSSCNDNSVTLKNSSDNDLNINQLNGSRNNFKVEKVPEKSNRSFLNFLNVGCNTKNNSLMYSNCLSSVFEQGYTTDESDETNDDIYPDAASSYSDDFGCRLKEINQRWYNRFKNVQKCKNKNISTKVHFPSEDKIKNVKTLVTWDYALRVARKGPWEQFARDTERFQRRIKMVQNDLGNIFDKMHREKVWNDRFLKLYS